MADDPLRRAFEDVRASAQFRVRRPGVQAALKTVKRRRTVKTAAAVVALVFAGVGAILNPWEATPPPAPAQSATPSATPSPATSVEETPSPDASEQVGGEPSKEPCANDGWAILVGRNGSNVTVRFTPDGGPNTKGILPCPGFQIVIFYTAYHASDGSPSSSNRKVLDSGHLTASIPYGDKDRCVDWFVGYSYTKVGRPEPEIPWNLPAGSADWGQKPPRVNGYFWDSRHNRNEIVDGAHNWGPCPTPTP